jgi:hypothetical protein
MNPPVWYIEPSYWKMNPPVWYIEPPRYSIAVLLDSLYKTTRGSKYHRYGFDIPWERSQYSIAVLLDSLFKTRGVLVFYAYGVLNPLSTTLKMSTLTITLWLWFFCGVIITAVNHMKSLVVIMVQSETYKM